MVPRLPPRERAQRASRRFVHSRGPVRRSDATATPRGLVVRGYRRRAFGDVLRTAVWSAPRRPARSFLARLGWGVAAAGRDRAGRMDLHGVPRRPADVARMARRRPRDDDGRHRALGGVGAVAGGVRPHRPSRPTPGALAGRRRGVRFLGVRPGQLPALPGALDYRSRGTYPPRAATRSASCAGSSMR